MPLNKKHEATIILLILHRINNFVHSFLPPLQIQFINVLRMVNLESEKVSNPGISPQRSLSRDASTSDVLGSLSKTLLLDKVQDSSKQFEHRYPIEVVGHRGSLYTALENTSRSFLHAAIAGADSVELDVFLLKCGTLVVFHGSGDDDQPGLLHLYCGIDGSILDYTAEDAKRFLTFNKDYDEFGCGPSQITHPDELMTIGKDRESLSHYCYVHTLEEVLTTLRDDPNVPPTLCVKIELKGPGTALPAVQLVQQLNMSHRCHYSSFDHFRIAEVRSLDPGAVTGALFADDLPNDFVERSLSVGASEVHLKYDTCTVERVNAAHNAGLGTMAWFRGPVGMKEDVTLKYFDVGNEDESMYDVVVRSGVKGMCVNRPDVMVRLAEKLKRRMNREYALEYDEEKKSDITDST